MIFILSGIALGLGALFPESYLCFFLFLIAAILFRLALEDSKRPYLGSFLTGVFFHVIAFYWLCQTVQVFGGLNIFLGFLVMLLFCLTAAVQFVLCAFFYRSLKGKGIALACAWVLASFIWPKMFPWEIAHGLVVLTPIAGLAEYVGVSLLSFLFIWWASVLAEFYLYKKHSDLIKCILITFFLIVIGFYRNLKLEQELASSPAVNIAMVQGNLSLEVKGKQAYFNANLAKYLELSRKLSTDLVIWPESVVSKWLHRDLENIHQENLHFALNAPLLFGGLVYELREQSEIENFIEKNPELATREFLNSYSYKKFNAGIGIDSTGKILGQYYKNVLMPFGEYVPFSEQYPKLKLMFPMIGDFTPGDLIKPIVFDKNIKAAALVCYEDLVSDLSVKAVNNGANLLVNLTNDAWYGKTPASHQHHLLALWRAIETRRFFLRSTNTGYTGVVSPFGKTIKSLPIFTEGVLSAEVRLLSSKTFYSSWGKWLKIILNSFIALVILYCRFFKV